MSFLEHSFKLAALSAESKSIAIRKKQIKVEITELARQVVGEIDRELITILFAKGVEIGEHTIDGISWYLVAMKDLGDLKKDPKDWRGDRIITSRVSFSSYDILYDIDTMYPIKLLGEPQHFKLSKSPEYYMSDAMMLTDCRGHRIHTYHSYEGYRSTPHWGPHFLRLECVERAVRDYVEGLSKGKDCDD